MKWTFGAAIGALAIAATPAAAQKLTLVCTGSGQTHEMKPREEKGKDGKSSTRYGYVHRDFEGVMQFRITDAGEASNGEVQVPGAMAGPGRAGEWFGLKNLKVGADAIEGKINLSLLTKPTFRIDRTTGAISLSDSQRDFTGMCRAADPEKRAF